MSKRDFDTKIVNKLKHSKVRNKLIQKDRYHEETKAVLKETITPNLDKNSAFERVQLQETKAKLLEILREKLIIAFKARKAKALLGANAETQELIKTFNSYVLSPQEMDLIDDFVNERKYNSLKPSSTKDFIKEFCTLIDAC